MYTVLLCTWVWPSVPGLSLKYFLRLFFSALRKQGLKQNLFNAEPITRLADCMERRLELGVT